MRLPIGIVCAISATIAPPATARDTKAWDTSGSVARDVLVVTALALPAAKGDWKGDLQALASIGGAFVVTTALKQTIRSRRPDGSDQHSFPSGHSSASFAAAATLHNRYGWKIGLPAQVVAVFVGVSRVQARRHRWGDVLAGAAIGEASGLLLTRRLNDNVRVVPWGDTRSGGVSVALRF
ncbi:phosphatase PAP2 family protein [Sphingomonas hylomeconis]|uniref:Phosphatase PAP2 family protein n=1 Tax=Sphingomonas hylomeconis TaxID=1395958 RepID=A0ABV7SY49_9SPHN|nr:phosphatase PAP2 family protein [Sphingomonas hylomeconis]